MPPKAQARLYRFRSSQTLGILIYTRNNNYLNFTTPTPYGKLSQATAQKNMLLMI